MTKYLKIKSWKMNGIGSNPIDLTIFNIFKHFCDSQLKSYNKKVLKKS